MHSKRDNIEIMINEDTDEVVREHFDSIKINLRHSLFKLWWNRERSAKNNTN